MQKLRFVLVFALVILSLVAFKTVVPAEEGSKVCLLGYKAFCSFTPVSTLILAAAAVGVFFVARNIILGRSA